MVGKGAIQCVACVVASVLKMWYRYLVGRLLLTRRVACAQPNIEQIGRSPNARNNGEAQDMRTAKRRMERVTNELQSVWEKKGSRTLFLLGIN